MYPFYAFEEYQVYGAALVPQGGDEPRSFARTGAGSPDNPASELDIGHGGVYLGDGVNPAAVDVAVGEGVEHVPESADAELLVQEGGPLLPDAGEVLDISVKNIGHNDKGSEKVIKFASLQARDIKN